MTRTEFVTRLEAAVTARDPQAAAVALLAALAAPLPEPRVRTMLASPTGADTIAALAAAQLARARVPRPTAVADWIVAAAIQACGLPPATLLLNAAALAR